MRLLRNATILAALALAGCTASTQQHVETKQGKSMKVKVATFNVSMEATNYAQQGQAQLDKNALVKALQSGENQQIKNIAEIIQRTNPDIILLNEFDYIDDHDQGIKAFLTQYLAKSQQGAEPVDYPYYYLAPVNTGVKVPEQDKSERLTHFGFGRYPGQYGMVVLSKYPIELSQTRTFQHFLWQHMPDNLMPVDEQGNPWYSTSATNVMRLSSKSHWDLPINVCGQQLHVLASHPTPPVFDGEEDRNGRRNFDEIRFWRDYIQADSNSYHYDDKGVHGGIKQNAKFVILGDLNASNQDGDAYPGAIDNLLTSAKVNAYTAPVSAGGRANKPDIGHAASHTASWGMRADYVLPSSNVAVTDSGVFWPSVEQPLYRLVQDRQASSDHRLVWAELTLPTSKEICQ